MTDSGATSAGDGLSGEQFRLLAELAPDAMIAHRDGTILWANQAAADLVKVDLATLVGRSLFDFVRPDDRAGLAADIARSVRDASGGTYIHTVLRSTGESVEAEFRRWPIGGGVLLVVARDLSAENQQRSAELRARAFFEASNEALGISRRGVHVEVNAAYARLFGYDAPAQLVGVPILDLIDPSEHERIRDYVVRRSRGEPLPESYSVLARRRGGETFLMEVRVSSYLEAGEPITVVVMRDVTAEREAEARVRHKEKLEAIGRLAGGVAHDFNNILAAILSSAELVSTRAPADPVTQEALSTISEATRHARDLVRQILAFGRRDVPGRRPLEPGKVVAEALTLARVGIASTVGLEIRIAAIAGTVIAEPTELQQVVLNLTANARDAVGASGRIEVSLDEVPDAECPPDAPRRCVRLRVRDDGVGIDAVTRARLFEPYVTTRAERGGHGLGLAVVHGIVTSLGGVIRVGSEPGHGATFDVYLPLTVEAVPPAPSPVQASGGAEHVLLVEDEPLVRGAVTRLLGALGYRVTTAKDGVEALELVKASPGAFALVISDITMPRMQGDALARALRGLTPPVPVILLSGYSDGLDEEQAVHLGAVALLAKPIDRASLAAAMRRALDTAAAR